ncbi:hypothetical protein ABWH93_06775 [Seohaeicola saemankumensis]|uniref:hypothetical protein n=1 Tax=Seohaeicola saemankumensis TaxID=481181 RepID=UPI0035CE994B
MNASTTIRIHPDTLPAHLDCSRLETVAQAIEIELREAGIAAEVSDVISHIKIEVPTFRLAATCVVLAGLQLI